LATNNGRNGGKIEEIKRHRRKWYNARASVYDKSWWENKESKEEMEGFKSLVKVKSGELVLDVATGTGIFLIEMAKDGATCCGIDLSPKMLQKLKNKTKRQGLEDRIKGILIGVADKLPFQDNLFDWVTCIGMLEYYPIEYAETVLNEIKRVLKQGKNCFIDIVEPTSKEVQDKSHIYKYALEAFETLIHKVGFETSTRNTAGWMIQYLLHTPNH
jgi:ubiquinone/menaquinone biosynthesis C-methylase UbiE